MSDEIKPDPVLTLPDMEAVRDAVDRNLWSHWEKFKYPYMWCVRAPWIEGLISEIMQREGCGTAYNAEVKKLARERLDMPALSDEGNATDGDTLSLLIYNSQSYIRSDRAKLQEAAETAAGWVRPSQEWLAQRRGKHVEVLHVKGLGRVVQIEITFYVRPPRAKKSVYNNSTIKVRDQGAAP